MRRFCCSATARMASSTLFIDEATAISAGLTRHSRLAVARPGKRVVRTDKHLVVFLWLFEACRELSCEAVVARAEVWNDGDCRPAHAANRDPAIAGDREETGPAGNCQARRGDYGLRRAADLRGTRRTRAARQHRDWPRCRRAAWQVVRA